MEADVGSFILLTSFLSVIYIYFKNARARVSFSHLPLPPSRQGYPLIGNLLEMPTEFEWKTFHQWSKELGMLSNVF